MPIVSPSSYRAPLPFRNGHLQTVYSSQFRRVTGVAYRRQRIATPDDDFLDVDMSFVGAGRIAIVTHGLGGNSGRQYVLGMARELNRNGWDALAWNFRGCSGESNRQLRTYHSGDTADLHTVVSFALEQGPWDAVSLIGFSLGGNITLKYLGEKTSEAAALIRAAVAFSVPCDLASSASAMASPVNTIYMKRFIRLLHENIEQKMVLFPGRIDDRGYRSIRNFKQFDDRYTAPLNGFESAQDYWQKASSKPFLRGIAVPTLLVNALDDPFLGPPCYPFEEARENPSLYLETPAHGGHVGFVSFNAAGTYWSEFRTLEFLNSAFA
ncbi:MAG: alpha/beta fold hydrolase [Syntrophobacteraceae bacterium]|nr:alpha/beta fold hydrolase [Desulfobacteraceae bacterium]